MEHKEYKSINKSVRKKDAMQLLLQARGVSEEDNHRGRDCQMQVLWNGSEVQEEVSFRGQTD